MLKALLGGLLGRNSSRAIENDPLFKVAVERSHEIIRTMGLDKQFQPSTIERTGTDILNEVASIIAAEDRFSRMRELLTEGTLSRAKLQVLVLEPEPGPDPSGLRGMGYLSGELKERLVDIVRADDQLEQWMYRVVPELTPDNVWNAILMRYWIDAWRAEVFNAVRRQMGDCKPTGEDDWYIKFLHAMCVYEEDNVRKSIGLPTLLPNNDFGLEALKYSTLMNIVLDGAMYPDIAWRDHYSKDADPMQLVAERMVDPD